MRSLAACLKEVVCHHIAILQQLHIRGAYNALLYRRLPFLCRCGRDDTAMVQKSNAVEIFNSQHTNLLTKQKSRIEKNLDTGLRHTIDTESTTAKFHICQSNRQAAGGWHGV